jgi:glycogen(starch) synthase
MHVLQLGPYPPPHGGVQTNLTAIRQYLLDRGIPCSVINLTRHRRENHDSVYYPESAAAVVKLLFTLPASILHVHLGGDVSPRLIGLLLCMTLVPGRKTVLTFHSGGYPSSPAGQTARPGTLRGFVFRRFDRIIAVNQAIVDLFLKFGVPQSSIRLILPHSIPAALPPAELPDRLRNFLDAHEQILLTVGLLEAEYDLPLQIDVLERVHRTHPKAGLIIAGSGSLEQDLRSHIASKPYASDILLYGDMPHAITLSLIRQCDLFLRTTLYDGDSVSVREALHVGTPVIASDNGMRPDGCILIPKCNIEALAEAIDANLGRALSTPALQRENDANLASVFQLYQEL